LHAFSKKKLQKIQQVQEVYNNYYIIYLVVISDNIFSRYIESDNFKIKLILKKIILIYSKFLKRKKLKFFYKYKANVIKPIINKPKPKIEKNSISSYRGAQGPKVYDRLFNYSFLKQQMLDNLLSRYLMNEEEKYTFNPKINKKDINYNLYYKYNCDDIFDDYNNGILLLTERKFRPKSHNNTHSKFTIDDFTSDYYNIYNLDNKTNKFRKTSFNGSNIDIFNPHDDYYKSYNYFPFSSNKKLKNYKRSSIPVTAKNRNKIYHNLFHNEDKDKNKGKDKNIDRITKNNKFNNNTNSKKYNNHMGKNLFKNKMQLNKTSSQFYPKLSKGNNTNNYKNIKNIFNNGIYNKNNDKDFSNYLKNKTNKIFKPKTLNQNEVNDIQSYKKSDKIIPKDLKNISMKDISLNHQFNPNKKDIYNNSNMSSYNISSISTNKKEEENKIMKSPVKKEHLFSFGTDLFYIDNQNNKDLKPSNSVINKSILVGNPFKRNNLEIKNERKKNIIKRNDNKSKTNSNTVRTNRISTNYSGSNSLYNLNKGFESNRPKNGRDKINQFEAQSVHEYNILNLNSLNHKNEDVKNGNYNLQTTLQSLTDSKILELANKYVSQEDDSVDSYRKKCIIYNKNHQK